MFHCNLRFSCDTNVVIFIFFCRFLKSRYRFTFFPHLINKQYEWSGRNAKTCSSLNKTKHIDNAAITTNSYKNAHSLLTGWKWRNDWYTRRIIEEINGRLPLPRVRLVRCARTNLYKRVSLRYEGKDVPVYSVSTLPLLCTVDSPFAVKHQASVFLFPPPIAIVSPSP